MCAAVFLTPPVIQHQPLKGGRGYDCDEVDKLLERVTSSYEQVWLERDELRSRVTDLEGELAAFRETERYLRDTLVTAQRTADELRRDAERDAERVRTEGLADLERAKAERRRELEDLRAEIEQLRTAERKLRASLRAFLEQALRQIDDGAAREAPIETLTDALSPDSARAERHNA